MRTLLGIGEGVGDGVYVGVGGVDVSTLIGISELAREDLDLPLLKRFILQNKQGQQYLQEKRVRKNRPVGRFLDLSTFSSFLNFLSLFSNFSFLSLSFSFFSHFSLLLKTIKLNCCLVCGHHLSSSPSSIVGAASLCRIYARYGGRCGG